MQGMTLQSPRDRAVSFSCAVGRCAGRVLSVDTEDGECVGEGQVIIATSKPICQGVRRNASEEGTRGAVRAVAELCKSRLTTPSGGRDASVSVSGRFLCLTQWTGRLDARGRKTGMVTGPRASAHFLRAMTLGAAE
jgi:hypothetical protein